MRGQWKKSQRQLLKGTNLVPWFLTDESWNVMCASMLGSMPDEMVAIVPNNIKFGKYGFTDKSWTLKFSTGSLYVCTFEKGCRLWNTYNKYTKSDKWY